MKKHTLAVALFSALPIAALAADPSSPPPEGWSGSGEAGLAIASGNTKSQNLNAKLDIKYNDEQWKDDFYLLAQRNKANDNLTANRYETGASAGYKLDDRSYIVGALRYEHDTFAPFTYQYIASIGYGYQFLRNSVDELSAEAGPGYKVVQQAATCMKPVDPLGLPVCYKPDSHGNVVLRGRIDYKHNFNANTSFVDSFTLESGSNNTFFQNDAGIAVKMSDKLALKAAWQVRHNSDPPIGKRTDQLLTTNLVYSF